MREGPKLYPVRLLAAGGTMAPTSAGEERTVRERREDFEATWDSLPAT